MNERQALFINWINERYPNFRQVPANTSHEIAEMDRLLIRGQDFDFNRIWTDPEKHPVAKYYMDERNQRIFYQFL